MNSSGQFKSPFHDLCSRHFLHFYLIVHGSTKNGSEVYSLFDLVFFLGGESRNSWHFDEPIYSLDRSKKCIICFEINTWNQELFHEEVEKQNVPGTAEKARIVSTVWWSFIDQKSVGLRTWTPIREPRDENQKFTLPGASPCAPFNSNQLLYPNCEQNLYTNLSWFSVSTMRKILHLWTCTKSQNPDKLTDWKYAGTTVIQIRNRKHLKMQCLLKSSNYSRNSFGSLPGRPSCIHSNVTLLTWPRAGYWPLTPEGSWDRYLSGEIYSKPIHLEPLVPLPLEPWVFCFSTPWPPTGAGVSLVSSDSFFCNGRYWVFWPAGCSGCFLLLFLNRGIKARTISYLGSCLIPKIFWHF